MALLTKVKTRMAVHAHRKVRGLLDGAYASVQLGRSMDFFDLREYVPGDEVKDIDWKSSARRGELLVKRFVAAHTQGTPMAGIEKSLKISEVTLRGDRGAVSVREGAAKITGYEQRVVARVAETSGQAILISYTCQGPVDYAKWTALKDATTVVGFLPESFAD